MTLKEMRQEAARLLAENQSLQAKVVSEERDYTADERAELEARFDRIDVLENLVKNQEKLEKYEKRELEAEERKRLEADRIRQESKPEQRAKTYTRAFEKWMRFGTSALGHEERTALQTGYRPLEKGEISAFQAEMRALGTDDTGSPYGGYTIPEDFMRRIDSAMLDFNGILETRAEVMRTSTGADLPYPTSNDTSNKGELLAEGNAAAEQDVVMGRVVFGAFTYSSKMVKVQLQLLQDSAFNLETFLADKFAERLGRITAEHMTTGDGSSKPRGITIAAAAGTQTLTTSAPTWLELVACQHEIDRAYRRNAEWVFNDTVLKSIRIIKSASEEIPIWNPGIAAGEPATILGNRYVIESEMPDYATDNRVVVFGDMSKYKIRRVRDMTLLRLSERYAEYLQVAFLAFLRLDADLVDAGTNPVKYFKST